MKAAPDIRTALRRYFERERLPGIVSAYLFGSVLVAALAKMPGFRNVVIYEYVGLDYARVIEALDELEPVERFLRIAAELETGSR